MRMTRELLKSAHPLNQNSSGRPCLILSPSVMCLTSVLTLLCAHLYSLFSICPSLWVDSNSRNIRCSIIIPFRKPSLIEVTDSSQYDGKTFLSIVTIFIPLGADVLFIGQSGEHSKGGLFRFFFKTVMTVERQ